MGAAWRVSESSALEILRMDGGMTHRSSPRRRQGRKRKAGRAPPPPRMCLDRVRSSYPDMASITLYCANTGSLIQNPILLSSGCYELGCMRKQSSWD
eukprot:10945138-Ditylum_brightwellii.AAC.1